MPITAAEELLFEEGSKAFRRGHRSPQSDRGVLAEHGAALEDACGVEEHAAGETAEVWDLHISDKVASPAMRRLNAGRASATR